MKELYLTILYLEVIIWVLVPVRHYRTRFFWFFLCPSMSGIVTEIIRNYTIIRNTSLAQFTLMTLGALSIIYINKHKTSFAGISVTFFYAFIVFLVHAYDFGWQVMMFGRAVIAGFTSFEITKLILQNFIKNREFNLFHFMLITFFTNMTITNLSFGLSGDVANNVGFIFFNLFVNFFYGLYFILFREDFRKFIFKV
ncbi:MAG: hypothetical protein HUU54_07535 [Ignavibacteriaceae bacterium]|nr:hypothetical protein [Ignavibacteriaceae bacterium]